MAEIAAAAPEVGSSRGIAPLSWLAAALAAESERRILWAPVWFGSGIALYFALTVEPRWWQGLAALGVAAIVALLLRRRRVWRSLALCLALAAAGFALITE